MVLNGIDRIQEYAHIFKGKRLGFLTSISGVDVGLRSSIGILHKQHNLTALFGPEHGVRGDNAAGEMVDTYTDSETGLPVYSLYRADSKRLTKEMLNNVDAVVYDIQDIGARFYTFISTLLFALEDCATNGKELIILDRFNPLGGTVVEGNILRTEFSSFVGCWPMPIRHGLTAGEFATMANQEKSIGCKLTVVHCKDWQRDMLFSETGNYWMMPSLGIPKFETALIYPGHCLFEGTNLSEGRGTTCPFEIIGAPFINAALLAEKMNKKNLPGLIYTAAYFKPSFSKHQGVYCGGIHAHITDPHAVRPVAAGVELLYTIREMYPKEFEFLAPYQNGSRQFIELLGGGDELLLPDKGEEVLRLYSQNSIDFAKGKSKYHLYA